MSEQLKTMTARVRHTTGTNAARRQRRLAGDLPAVLYGGKKPTIYLTLSHRELTYAMRDESFASQIIELDIDGKKEQVVLKDVQYHPFKREVLHVDFFRISSRAKLHMKVPLHYEGEEEAPGVKTHKGLFSRVLTEVEVVCLPADLPEFLSVDVSQLELEGMVHLSDLTLPKGVALAELLQETPNDALVASISKPKGGSLNDDGDAAEAAGDNEGADAE